MNPKQGVQSLQSFYYEDPVKKVIQTKNKDISISKPYEHTLKFWDNLKKDDTTDI